MAVRKTVKTAEVDPQLIAAIVAALGNAGNAMPSAEPSKAKAKAKPTKEEYPSDGDCEIDEDGITLTIPFNANDKSKSGNTKVAAYSKPLSLDGDDGERYIVYVNVYRAK